MRLDVKRYHKGVDIYDKNAEELNESLLVKMLKTDFLTKLAKSDNRDDYKSNKENILLLPGIWDDDLFLCDKGCVMKGIVRNINDVQVGDKLFVLGASSFINNLENDKIDEDTMNRDASDIINGSHTSVTLTNGSDSWKLTNESGDPEGGFDRKDLPANDYSLEPGVWRESVDGKNIKGAYSSLFCIIEPPSKGHYQLEIENTSQLYNASPKKFELEVKYQIEVL
ncbi:MAG: hypothetical protein L0H53_07120 [Candidatus Nitrosocosmicus sp.]|nr:hypothetical protein [Candidatus Nitrosocosmicus sp.]MDN5867252.1 hypothetical protein [Candidatus Nitrosocosmicus sp.]